jgi:hypothetical protein
MSIFYCLTSLKNPDMLHSCIFESFTCDANISDKPNAGFIVVVTGSHRQKKIIDFLPHKDCVHFELVDSAALL